MAIEFVEQVEQRGTGDAMSVALTGLPDDDDDDDGDVVVLPGRHPAAPAGHPCRAGPRATGPRDAAATLLTAVLDDPDRLRPGGPGPGRRRWPGSSSTPTRPTRSWTIDEVNTSIYCFRRSVLAPSLRRLSPANAQGEYYLTDVVEVLYEAGHQVGLGRGRRPDGGGRGQRPGPAGRGRGRAAGPDQRALDAPGGHHVGSARRPTSTSTSSSAPDVVLLPGRRSSRATA